MEIFTVIISDSAKQDLLKAPLHIARKLQSWVENIENDGFNQVRKIPGFHDEALKGKRSGQRSIRLNKAYRAIYDIDVHKNITIIKVIEVHKHDY